MDGKTVAKRWKLDVRQARYSEWGNWYSKLTEFPAALVDKSGYLLVPNEGALQQDGIHITKQINVPRGIASLPSYIRMLADIPEEVVSSADRAFIEGSVEKVLVNRYERDPRARKKCIEHHGAICAACRTNMAALYGDEFEGFIHVHHIVPLSDIAKEYQVDAVADLRPLCPNCHAVVHRFNPPLSVEQVRQRLAHRRSEK